MDNKLEQLEKRYRELETLLSDPGVLANQAKFRDYAREHRSLGATIFKYDELKSLRRQIEDSRAMLLANEDPEMTAMAKAELEELEPKLKALEEERRLSPCGKKQCIVGVE